MAFDVVTPYSPTVAMCGGVVDGKAVVVDVFTGLFEVTVLDPVAKSVRVGRTPAPAGYDVSRGRYGATIGSEVWVGRASGGLMTLAAVSSDTSAIFHPSPFSMGAPSVLRVGSRLWVFSDSYTYGAYTPQVFDVPSLTWVTGHGMSVVSLAAQPVYGGGYVWGISGGTLYRWDPSTYTRTIVVSSDVSASGQVAVAGSFAYWASGTTLTRLDMTSGAITTQTMGVSFSGWSLVFGSDGVLYTYSASGSGGAIRSFNPLTGQSASQSVTPYGSSFLGFLIGSKLVFPGR